MDIEKNKYETPKSKYQENPATTMVLLIASWNAAPRFTGKRRRLQVMFMIKHPRR